MDLFTDNHQTPSTNAAEATVRDRPVAMRAGQHDAQAVKSILLKGTLKRKLSFPNEKSSKR